MKNGLMKILGLATLGAGLLFTPVQKTNANEVYFYGNLGISTYLRGSVAQVETVPEYIRTVLPHPDDITTFNLNSNPILIPDQSLSLEPGSINIETRGGLGIKGKKFNFEIGPTLNFGIVGGISFNSANQENYYPGGYDAFTYYALTMGNQNSRGCVTPGVFVRESTFLLGDDEDGIKFFTEYSAELYEFMFENGWNRYNQLESNSHYKIADSINHSMKIGLELLSGAIDPFLRRCELSMGITFPQIVYKTSLADETKFTTTPNILFGIRLGPEFKFKKK